MSSTAPPVDVVVMLDSLRQPGGGERLAVEGAVRLDPERFNRSLCVTRWEDSFDDEEAARDILIRLRESGVRVIPIRRRGRFDIRAWISLLRILRRERISVLHAHKFGSNVWAAVLGTLARVPAVVAHEHMWSYEGGKVRPFLDRFLIAPFTDAFVAVSREGFRRMVEIERIPEKDLVLIPNGIASSAGGDGAKVRAEFGIDPEAPLVGSVGHLRPEKAFEILIEAAGILREKQPGLRVLIAGEGPEREMLEALRSRLGLEDVVLLPGAREDVPDILDALDLAICCSNFEGGPLSVMEYMDAGLPVLATNVGGLPELIVNDETGVLVPARDPGALAAAAGALLSDEATSRRLGEAGRELRRSEYDVDVWIGRIEKLYDDLLAGKGGVKR